MIFFIYEDIFIYFFCENKVVLIFYLYVNNILGKLKCFELFINKMKCIINCYLFDFYFIF